MAPSGGGVLCEYDANLTIADSVILRNVATRDGGGLLCWNIAATITNCVFAGNAASEGGAIFSGACDLTITNCTITANSATNGPALACNSDWSSSDIEITDCILWNGDNQLWNNDDSTITITYSDVQGGWPGEGNIDADPLFVGGFLGDYYLSQTAAGQPVDSPCVNTGSDTAENLGLDTRTTRTDQVGDAGIVDMGYHYPIECPGDLDGDGDTDQADLGILLADWGCDDPANGCVGDLNGDDRTDQADLGILLADWGCAN